MEEVKLKEFREDFALLIEAGFVAVKQLDEVSARRIFQAAQVMSPSSTAPQIGLGYIALNKLEIKEATKVFESVLKQEPENYLAQTFLGICFLLTQQKMKKGEKLIKDAMEKSDDPTIKNLGQISLEWGEKDLKKNRKAPFFVASKKEGEKDSETEKESETESQGDRPDTAESK
jgi:predicted Zn-dependent protease